MFTFRNIVPIDSDVSIPVRSALFVEEAKSVHDFVDDDAFTQTASRQLDVVYSISPVGYWRRASEIQSIDYFPPKHALTRSQCFYFYSIHSLRLLNLYHRYETKKETGSL